VKQDAEQERLAKAAAALIEERKRMGVWSGGVRAHSEYRGRMLDWIVEKLGIPRETLVWSANPEYQQCTCASETCSGGCEHQWDGDVDPFAKATLALDEGNDVGIESATGTGKAQPVDEPVLTPTGWRTMGELRPGDFVIGSNGAPTEVLAVYPQGTRPVYSLQFSDGASTRACAEHLWVMQNKKDLHTGCPWRIMTTADLAAMDARTIHNRSLRVPLPGPVQYEGSVDLPLDPYLLGVLLGDGCFRAGGHATFSSADAEIVESVRASVPQGMHVVYSSGYDYRIVGGIGSGYCQPNKLKAILGEMGLWGAKSENKFVPQAYMHAPPKDRLELLRGLLDTDGHVTRGQNISFATTSPVLAKDVAELARGLGGTASTVRAPSYCNGERKRDHYRVSVNMPEGVVPFRLRRKASVVEEWGARSYGLPSRILRSVTPAGEAECVCIRVAAHDALYVTKDYIVTHNTFWLACITLAFLAIYENSLVVTAAPKADQLYLNLWKEIGALWPRFSVMFPQAELLTGRLRMKPAAEDGKERWAAVAFVAGVGADEESATKAQGFHAEHMLIITEETPGMHPAIMNALFNTRTDDHNLQVAVGNPDHRQDPLHEFCETPGVVNVRISAYDHPNVVAKRRVVPGAIGEKRLLQRINKLGRGTRLYQSRIRGISPTESEDALIKWEWCEAAAKRHGDEELRKGEQAMGVDVANSQGGDKASKAYWQGAVCTNVEDKKCPDANALGKEVVLEARGLGIDPKCVGVDGVGVGAGTVNKANEMKFKVRDLKGNAKPIPFVLREPGDDDSIVNATVEAERYANLRSQMWWRMREDLRLHRIGLPNDPELFKDLTTPTYTTQNGKITVESKEEIQKRLGRSPNKGDSCVYGNWVRKRAVRSRPKAEAAKKRDRNTDTGLEKLLDRLNKRDKAKRRGGTYGAGGGR
jgi:hypothetical protein